MSPRTTGLLALVAIGLGAFVYLYEIAGESSREADSQAAKNIHTGLEVEQVEAISLVTLDGVPARFERRDGVWFLVEPVPGRAEATALDAIAHALVNLPREGTVGKGESLEAFQLGPEAPTIRFEADGRTLGLRIGRTTPVGGHRYVARLDDDEVAYVESYRINPFNRNLADLRDRRIFDFEEGAIETIRLVWPDRVEGANEESGASAAGATVEVALARAADGKWYLGAPVVGLADQETVRDLLSNLAFLRVEKFVDAPDDAVRSALEETALAFHWTLEGEHLERHARIAGAVGGVGEQRVFESGAGRVDLISASRLEEFARSLVQYRFRRLADFDLADARYVVMRFSSSGETGSSEPLEATARLEATGWQGTDSEGGTIRAAGLSNALRKLSNLRATDIFAEEMGPRELARLGLDPPRATIEVRSRVAADAATAAASKAEGDPSLAQLRFGRPYPGRGTFVQRSDSSTVFLIDAEATEGLPISVEEYREALQATADSAEGMASVAGMASEALSADSSPDANVDADPRADEREAEGELELESLLP